MNELTWTFDSKVCSGALNGAPVPPGPWDDEPDKIQWIDDATGLDCLIVRGPFGALCGYVGVPPEHPYYQVEPEKIDDDIYVHGGLNFATFCMPGEPVEGICHVAEHGATEKPWWLGFDCSHAGDYHPLEAWMEQQFGNMRERNCTYKNVAYVKAQVGSLADQLAKHAP